MSRNQFYISLASLSHFLLCISYLQYILRRINLVKHSKYMMGASTYFYLVICIMSLMQRFPCESAKPNIIMIVADDLVSWKFIFSVFFKDSCKNVTIYTVSAPLSAGGTTFSSTFWKKKWDGVRKQMNSWGDLKTFCHRYLPLKLLYFFFKKFFKIKYGFEGSISNVDLGSKPVATH